MRATVPSVFLVICLISGALAWGTESQENRPVTAEQKKDAVTDLAQQLRARYAIGGVAEKLAAFIEKKLADGGYDTLTDGRAFSDALTRDLQEVSNDRHLRVGLAVSPPAAPMAKPPDPEAEQVLRQAAMRRGNFGFPKVEILPGNVGYLDIRRFQPPELAGDTVVAVMGFLANVDALIVDVRQCSGGSAFMMPLFNAYFFTRPTQLFEMQFRGDNVTENYWTMRYVPGKHLAEVPLFILTSARTFSGAEGFAYRFQVLKRATIVGETTGGGANAGGVRDVAPFFRVWMPMGRPVDPDTGKNWEGTGVEPDIKVAAREALATAHLEALKVLRGKATADADRQRLDWAARRAAASLSPVALSEKDLARFAGTYGNSRVWVEGGQLRFQRETGRTQLLMPITGTTFAIEVEDPAHLEFVAGPTDRIEKLIYTDAEWKEEVIPRSL